MYNAKYIADGEEELRSSRGNIGLLHMILYFLVIIVLEIIYKVYNRKKP